ncbi:HPP family protein [Desulfitobacterium sp. Sab5]|uniref:HPP family protein n=1 Tax=Desulfitobacterium nosdiversum TaxID=3375356 RepID=UPI003CEA728C
MLQSVSKIRIKAILLKYFSKFKGKKRMTPLVSPAPLDIFISLLGSLIGISILSLLLLVYKIPILAAPLGASVVLVFWVSDAPLSQPRNVILGHTISAAIGVMTYQLWGMSWWSVAIGTSTAILGMVLTKTTHPPGGATALLAILSAAEPSYIFTPILAGSLILILIGVLVNNLSPNRNYPRYWY